MKAIEAGARALKEALGVALGAKPLQPDRRIPVRSDDWYTDPGASGSIDLEELFKAALLAASSAEIDEGVVEEVARAIYIATSTNPNPAERFDRAIEWALDEDSGELPAWIVDLKREALAAIRATLKAMGS